MKYPYSVLELNRGFNNESTYVHGSAAKLADDLADLTGDYAHHSVIVSHHRTAGAAERAAQRAAKRHIARMSVMADTSRIYAEPA